MPYWEAFRKSEDKKKRRKIEWDDVFCAIGGGIMLLLIIAIFVIIGLYFITDCNQTRINNSVTSGIVVDMGSYAPSRNPRQYSYWISVMDGEITATWSVSDAYYSRVRIGDHVEKGVLPEVSEDD